MEFILCSLLFLHVGVTSFEVDLQRKKVVVTGHVTPLEVLQSVSKVKLAQLWMPPQLC